MFTRRDDTTRSPAAAEFRAAPVWFAVLAAAIAVSGAGCSGGGDAAGDRAEIRRVAFDNWDQFLDSGEHKATKPRHVVMIGLDGAPWHFVDKLIEEGRMPNLARIKNEGAYATLVSNRTAVTPPAWTSMFTGYAEEQTGIYSFGTWIKDIREFVAVNSDDVQVPFMWEAASRAGLKTGVFNVPMTYPVYPVNGALVTGMMTPIHALNATNVTHSTDPALLKEFRSAAGANNFSKPLRAALSDSLNHFLFVIHDTSNDRQTNYDRVSLRILPRYPEHARAAANPQHVHAFDTGLYSQWLPFLHRRGDEVVRAWCRINLRIAGGENFNIEFSQTVFPMEDAYTYPEELHDTLTREFGFYLPTKFLSKEVVPALTGDMASYAGYFYDYDDWDLFTFVFTQTDNIHHLVGFSTPAAGVYETVDRAIGEILSRMPPGGVMFVTSDHGNGEYEWGIDLNQAFTRLRLLQWKSPGVIDHDRTLVFHNLWHLYFDREKITVEELAGRGIDVPAGEDPYEYLIRYVTAAGRQIRADGDGRRFPVRFHRITARNSDSDPVLWVEGAYGDYAVDYWNIKAPHATMIRRLQGSDRFWHIRDGIVLVWGEGVRGGYDAGKTEIQNIAPTVLYLLGLPVAPDMAGNLVEKFFEPSFLRDRALFVNAGYRDIPRHTAPDADYQESLERKLKSLGYIQ